MYTNHTSGSSSEVRYACMRVAASMHCGWLPPCMWVAEFRGGGQLTSMGGGPTYRHEGGANLPAGGGGPTYRHGQGASVEGAGRCV